MQHQPKAKSVVIYTYFSSWSSDYNLAFFLKSDVRFRPDIDYIFVINGEYHPPHIQFPKTKNVWVLKRQNKGFDFGGHSHALKYLKENNQSYDYYFFLNSGVIGPFLSPTQPKQHWTKFFIKKITVKVKLVGTTIVCLPKSDRGGYGPKVEGFFFMVDSIGLKILEDEKSIFRVHQNKVSAILDGEYGLSNCIFKHGYTIDCMLPPYQNVDWLDAKNYDLNDNKHPSRQNSFFVSSINPFDVFFHKWFWHGQPTVNVYIVESYVNNYKEY